MRDDERYVLGLAAVAPLEHADPDSRVIGRDADGRPWRVPATAWKRCARQGWLDRCPLDRPGRGLVHGLCLTPEGLAALAAARAAAH